MTHGLAGLAVLAAAAVAVAGEWRDNFGGPKLHERWTWHVPVPGPTISLAARRGWLRLTVPQAPRGFNHWVRVQDAAVLRTPAPGGDWDLTARLKLSAHKPNSNLHLGLVVGFSPEHVLAWGPFLSKALYPEMTRPEIWAEPTGRGAYLRADVGTQDLELQIAKRAETYRLRHRRAEEAAWTEAGCYPSCGASPQSVGLLGKSFAANPAGALDVDFIALTPHLEPAAEPFAATAAIGKVGERLPGSQRGFFLEFLGHCIFQGIWAERLHNRKFIGPGAATGIVWKWEPFGQAKDYAPDRAEPYAEPQSQRIALTAAEGGIQQRGLALASGSTHALRIVAKAMGSVGSLRVALHDARGAIDAHSLSLKGADWKTLTCTLTASRGARDAALVIAAKGPGTLWLGAASLMPADHAEGFRRDLLEVTRLARAPSFRWPGGNMASGYHWRDGIGPHDRRPTRWDRAWKAWVYNDMGTDEFIRYCRLLGAEPCICVNAGEGTVYEAAAWVQYCNGAPDTPMGRLRARNGHPEPYGVKHWDIGNEIWGSWQLGHTGPEQYGLRAVEFARAMRREDPSIVLIASGVLDNGFEDWNRRMLKVCGPSVDMLSVHDYTNYDARQCTEAVWRRVVGAPLRIEGALRNTVRIAREAAGKHLPLTFDEWNTVPEHGAGGHGLPDALYAAGVFHAMQRCGGDVAIGNLALLVNVIGALRCDATRVLQTPVFLAFRLFADHSGPWSVAAAATCPRLRGMPLVDVAATLSEDRGTLHITAINRDPRRPARIAWALGGLTPQGEATVTTLSGRDPWARMELGGPASVSLVRERLPWREAAERLVPSASVVGLSIPLKSPAGR